MFSKSCDIYDLDGDVPRIFCSVFILQEYVLMLVILTMDTN